MILFVYYIIILLIFKLINDLSLKNCFNKQLFMALEKKYTDK